MATATKKMVTTTEIVLILTNAEAHELDFYLAVRGTTGYRDTARRITDGIRDALREVLR